MPHTRSAQSLLNSRPAFAVIMLLGAPVLLTGVDYGSLAANEKPQQVRQSPTQPERAVLPALAPTVPAVQTQPSQVSTGVAAPSTGGTEPAPVDAAVRPASPSITAGYSPEEV